MVRPGEAGGERRGPVWHVMAWCGEAGMARCGWARHGLVRHIL